MSTTVKYVVELEPIHNTYLNYLPFAVVVERMHKQRRWLTSPGSIALSIRVTLLLKWKHMKFSPSDHVYDCPKNLAPIHKKPYVISDRTDRGSRQHPDVDGSVEQSYLAFNTKSHES